ncbi:hypothetical protein Golax_021321, partial [Gossypium laxum]|nr:hypothetical protein [Gossypium laxum]
EVQNLGTYLEPHLLHDRVTNSTLSFVVDKDQNMSILVKIGFNLISKDSTLWLDPLETVQIFTVKKTPGFQDLVKSDGTWNLDLFRIWLSDYVINCIVSILPPHPDPGSNRNVTWSTIEAVKVSISWAQQLEFHQNGYNINISSSKHNSHANSLWVNLYMDEVVARDTRNASAGGILDELFQLLNKGYKRATIQTDNLDVV